MSAENMLSPPPDDVTWVTKLGNDTPLPPGVEVAARMAGSISSSVKKDAFSSSGLVLVIVRNESSNSFCSTLGVPLRSRICKEILDGARLAIETFYVPFGSWRMNRLRLITCN